ncbi:hypothetical protein MFIFM68171_05698 [Madurella fahalii]|uniref:Uncharacterized protein n=1 Tax=Madurella fahalii TaxID=1157608 RepID=A0ABQ0GCL8_9PEZI
MPRFEVGIDPKYVDAQRVDCLSAWTAIAMDRNRQLGEYDGEEGEENDLEEGFCVRSLLRLTAYLEYLRKIHEAPEPEELDTVSGACKGSNTWQKYLVEDEYFEITLV